MHTPEWQAILEIVTAQAGCKVIVERLMAASKPEAVAAITAGCANCAILETLQSGAISGRFSIYAADPVELFTIASPDESALAHFAKRVGRIPRINTGSPLPFNGGWIGYLSYESLIPKKLVRPREIPLSIPLIRFGLYDHALVLDHEELSWFAIAVDWSNWFPKRTDVRVRLGVLRDRADRASRVVLPDTNSVRSRIVSEAFTREQYRSRVRRIQQYIEAGDIYQANLAQRFEVETDVAAFEIYRNLRAKNPSTFAAYVAWDDKAILSASPELFLRLRGDRVVTRPIKGTRPRTGVEKVDGSARAELQSSEKERAELNMIIDLLRNDLGRVCRYGSVRVVNDGEIEAHPTVYHRVATIEGRLGDGKDWRDLLEAAFPGGSIVGAPKIRAMQIIRELEPFGRGPYCGAIGWIGLDGNMTLSIAIRTMVWGRGRVVVFAGGAIVADSQPEAEYAEIEAKARGLFASLGVRDIEPTQKREEVSAA